MVYSMTGFGRAVTNITGYRITAEAKSLNSKQLDLSVRMPSRFRDIEMTVREKAAKILERGKVEMNVYFELTDADAAISDISADVNLPVVTALKRRISEVADVLDIPEPADWYQVLFRFPEAVHSDKPHVLASEEENKALISTVDECLKALMRFRSVEGRKLEEFLTLRVDNIGNLLGEVDKYEHQRVEKIKEKISEGLKKITQIEVDNNRLEQELIFYIEKLDVSEEKQRLKQHLDYFRETLKQSQPGQGKKLGFIAQEMGREINTLGSKSNHAELQKIVVKMKDELEQIKEQVLNVM